MHQLTSRSLYSLQRVTETRNKVVITDRMWARLLSSTNQPSFLSAKDIEEAKKAENLQKWRSSSGKFTLDGHHVEDDNQAESNGMEAGVGN